MAHPATPGLLLISAGSLLTSMIISGFLLGYLLDRWLNTLPVFMLLMGLLGIVGGAMKVLRLLNHPGLNKP
ncbi:MAG: AtpZ/AtpI family protein [Pseudomonadota bacterium]